MFCDKKKLHTSKSAYTVGHRVTHDLLAAENDETKQQQGDDGETVADVHNHGDGLGKGVVYLLFFWLHHDSKAGHVIAAADSVRLIGFGNFTAI